MQEARMLGNYVEHLAEEKQISVSELSQILSCSDNQVRSFFKGRAFASFEQLALLAKTFGLSVRALLAGDTKTYTASVVDCMNDFDDPSNREYILDIIDSYMDILDAVND